MGRASSFLRSWSIAAACRSITIRPSAASFTRRLRSLTFSASMRLFFVSRSRSRASMCPMRDSERLIQTVSADLEPASSARTPLLGDGGAPPPPAESHSARANRPAATRVENRRSCRFLFFRLSGSTRVLSCRLIAPPSQAGFHAPPRRAVRPMGRLRAKPATGRRRRAPFLPRGFRGHPPDPDPPRIRAQ